jgi:hypothetical protein
MAKRLTICGRCKTAVQFHNDRLSALRNELDGMPKLPLRSHLTSVFDLNGRHADKGGSHVIYFILVGRRYTGCSNIPRCFSTDTAQNDPGTTVFQMIRYANFPQIIGRKEHLAGRSLI